MTTFLVELRTQIDDVDHRIIILLAERAGYVTQVGKLKNSDDEIVAADRQQQVYQSRRAWAAEVGINPDFVERLYRVIVEHFIEEERQQLAARNNEQQ
jgi:isochorismate pyruvate lyase